MVDGLGDNVCPVPTKLDVRLTTAPMFFGNIFAWLFLAWVTLQAYTWYTNWKRDSWVFRAFVGTVIIITLAETGLETGVAYQYLVSNWGDNCILADLPKAILFQPAIIAITGTMVDSFYIWRIWIFGRSFGGLRTQYLFMSICICVAVLTLLSVACAIAIPVLFLQIGQSPELVSRSRVIVALWTISAALADILITVSMMTVLWRAALKSYSAETRDTLSQLCRLTCQSGLLTSVLATAIFIVFITEKEGTIHTLPAYLLGKSYPMSLLASLNARTSVGSGRDTSRNTDRLSSLVFSPGAVKTRASLRLQQDMHSFQLPEALGRSHTSQRTTRMDTRTRRNENPYRSAETNGTTGGVQVTSFVSNVSSGEDQPRFGSAIDTPNKSAEMTMATEKNNVRCLSDYVESHIS